MQPGIYGLREIEQILNFALLNSGSSPYVIREDSIYKLVTSVDGSTDYQRVEIGLPIPFISSQLAVFMLDGLGAEITKSLNLQFGESASIIDPHLSDRSREALQTALDLAFNIRVQVDISNEGDKSEIDSLWKYQLHKLATDEAEYVLWYPVEEEVDLHYWLCRRNIHPKQAAALLWNKSPLVEENNCLTDVQKLALAFEEHVAVKCLPEARPLHEWVDIARTQGFKHTPEVARLVDAECKVTKSAPEVTPKVKSPPDWKELAKIYARAFIEERAKKELYPSLLDVADYVAKRFREERVTGVSGKPMTAQYIKRHGLNGISSTQHEPKSMSNNRGK